MDKSSTKSLKTILPQNTREKKAHTYHIYCLELPKKRGGRRRKSIDTKFTCQQALGPRLTIYIK